MYISSAFIDERNDMEIWLHRISHHAETSDPLIKKGFLTIGFSNFNDTSEFIKNTEEKGWSYFDSQFQQKYNSLPRSRHSLWRFIHEMKKGDWVLVPSCGDFSIYKIADDSALPMQEINFDKLNTWSGEPVTKIGNYLYENNNIIDLGFFRKVTVIERGISRNEFADSMLTSRMKIRSTNANITDLKDSVEKALTAYKENRPINLHSKIMEESKSIVLSLIQKELNPDKFELLIKWYFEKIGASNVYIPAKNERDKQGDADVVAVFEPIKTIFYVQAKFHSGETSDWATQQIMEYKENKEKMDDGYSKIGWVVSTSDNFSPQCKDLAKDNNIVLFSGLAVAQMLLDAGIENLDKTL
jgi:predicted Mrr-cat superfamily restriction endonuclease